MIALLRNRISLRSLRSKSGFTLVELLVVLGIFGIVLGLAYSLLFYNQRSYSLIETRINAQNEFRFIMNHLEKEIGTATELILSNDVDTSLEVESGYRLVYIEESDGEGKVVSKEASIISYPITSSSIPGLKIEFSRVGATIIKVKLQADGDHVLEKEIFTQNAKWGDINALYSPETYAFLRVNPVD